MPQSAAYSGKKLILVKLLRTENKDICVNLVMPVMKTKRSYSPSDLRMANTSRYTSVHASCSGVQFCCLLPIGCHGSDRQEIAVLDGGVEV